MSVEWLEKQALLRINGRLDQESVMQAWPDSDKMLQSIAKVGKPVKMDLSELQTVDTAGLAWLLLIYRSCQDHGINVESIKAPESLHKLANLSDLDGLLPLQ